MPKPTTVELPSKGEINRCGDRLRDFMAGKTHHSRDELDHAVTVVNSFRANFQYPMVKVTMGVRQFVDRESGSIVVAQRLKRFNQIIHKLQRFPDTKLARMEDVGGCRAVLDGGAPEVAGVLRRITRNWEIVRLRDYTATPKETGYRGIHVIVVRDGARIEIQLRTVGQQAWADAVERTQGRLDVPLKDGQGPDDLLLYFRLAGQGIAYDEAGERPPTEFVAEFERVRARAIKQGYFQRVG